MNDLTSRKKQWVLTQQTFDDLLAWLAPEREQAGRKYEEIRYRLIKIFTCRGCPIPEELADETINRVTRKLAEVAATYVGDPALYFYGVAHNVHLEYLRKKPQPVIQPPVEPEEDSEREYECLDECMQKLTEQNRTLVLEYYQEDKQAKINQRRELAERLGIALNALRIRAHRIRAHLQKCVLHCLSQ